MLCQFSGLIRPSISASPLASDLPAYCESKKAKGSEHERLTGSDGLVLRGLVKLRSMGGYLGDPTQRASALLWGERVTRRRSSAWRALTFFASLWYFYFAISEGVELIFHLLMELISDKIKNNIL